MRAWFWLGLLCPVLAQAGPTPLAFDYPVALQPEVRFYLHVRTAQGGQSVQETRPLTLTACGAFPDPAATPETVCATVCLEPGETTLSVIATKGSEVSDDSLPVDADLSGEPCRPVTVVPKKPPKVDPKTFVEGGLIVGGGVVIAQGAKPPSLVELPNLNCVSWKITGVCACGFPPSPCVQVEYWEPGWLVEIVKHPGTTILPILGPILDVVLQVAKVPPLGGGGAGGINASGSVNLHYAEAHVFTYPQFYGGPCTQCVPTPKPPTLHYASELDAVTWRTVGAIPSPLDLVMQVGTWGRLYPRGGKVIQASQPVAAALQAVRAMDITALPIGVPPNIQDTHVVIEPTGNLGRCIQPAWPASRPCMVSGTPQVLWEHGAVSPGGNYVYIIWRERKCCVDPAKTTCGITLAGGKGENWCIPGSAPSP